MTYHPHAHFDDCRSSLCDGCYDDPLADLGVAARAALVEKAKAIPAKTFVLDELTPEQRLLHTIFAKPGTDEREES